MLKTQEDLQTFISIQMLFMERKADMRLANILSNVEDFRGQASAEIIGIQAEYAGLLEEITSQGQNAFGEYKH